MRYAGKLIEWNDDRGFGFIEPTQGGDKVFLSMPARFLAPTARRVIARAWVIASVLNWARMPKGASRRAVRCATMWLAYRPGSLRRTGHALTGATTPCATVLPRAHRLAVCWGDWHRWP